jgi:hypothetical protein
LFISIKVTGIVRLKRLRKAKAAALDNIEKLQADFKKMFPNEALWRRWMGQFTAKDLLAAGDAEVH